MNTSQQELWRQILQFPLDDPEAAFSFSERLARENDWSLDFALRVSLEYKKFMFLVSLHEEALTPSDEVDQAWHLHLLYTRSYWEEFCRGLLRRDIHHGPTKGGREEDAKFTVWYERTLAFYKDLFGYEAPLDIWPPSYIRFRAARFVRVDKRSNWIIPKRIWKNP